MFERLRFLRRERKLTCEDMAKLLGLETKAAYSKKELGHTRFTLAEAKKIADSFGLRIEDIFFANEVSSKDISA
jgi:DNA-binding XRE family transcriptional regulator